MPNANYIAGRVAEYAAIRDLRRLGFKAQRNAASHGEWDVTGIRSDLIVFAQLKRGEHPPSPAEYQTLVDMAVPPCALKLVLYYPSGVGCVRSGAVRILYHNIELPLWCAQIRWLDGLPPPQPRLYLRN